MRIRLRESFPRRVMDPEQTVDGRVRVEIYRFFVERGRPPVPAELAESLEMDQAAVEDSLKRLAEGHVLVLAPGTPYIWMANPLSALPTPLRRRHGRPIMVRELH